MTKERKNTWLGVGAIGLVNAVLIGAGFLAMPRWSYDQPINLCHGEGFQSLAVGTAPHESLGVECDSGESYRITIR